MANSAKMMSNGRIAVYQGTERLALIERVHYLWFVTEIHSIERVTSKFQSLGDALDYLKVADLDGEPRDRLS